MPDWNVCMTHNSVTIAGYDYSGMVHNGATIPGCDCSGNGVIMVLLFLAATVQAWCIMVLLFQAATLQAMVYNGAAIADKIELVPRCTLPVHHKS